MSKGVLADSICMNCARPLRECDYLLNSEKDKPCFYEGSKFSEKEVAVGKTKKITVYVMESCPRYLPPENGSVEEVSGCKKASEEDVAEMLVLRKQGLTIAEISIETGWSETTVKHYLKREKAARANTEETDESIIGDLRREVLALSTEQEKPKKKRAAPASAAEIAAKQPEQKAMEFREITEFRRI